MSKKKRILKLLLTSLIIFIGGYIVVGLIASLIAWDLDYFNLKYYEPSTWRALRIAIGFFIFIVGIKTYLVAMLKSPEE